MQKQSLQEFLTISSKIIEIDQENIFDDVLFYERFKHFNLLHHRFFSWTFSFIFGVQILWNTSKQLLEETCEMQILVREIAKYEPFPV